MNALDAHAVYEAKGPDGADEAMAIINACLTADPNDVDALSLAGRIHYDAGHFGMSEVMTAQALRLNPLHSGAWQELGRAAHARQEDERAAKFFSTALRITGDRFTAYNNLILMNNSLGRPEKALEMAHVARFLSNNADDDMALNGNVAISCLMLRKWAAGWANYDAMLQPGHLRKELTYEISGEKLPRWDGAPGGEVIVYGEQGLGDEIMFASMIDDMMAGGTMPIIHADRRLAKLFARSFPCPVYGGRGKKTGKEWLKNHAPKAAIAIGSLGQFYRRNEADFPRVPYLKADPAKRAMCRALLDQWPGRKIGIAWTGGTSKTRTADRSLTLAELEPILALEGVTFVSLEYKGEHPADHRIKDVQFLTRSQDYDDTAALVAELDAVVSVTTSVAHLAGALGTECHVMVPEAPTWHWCRFGESPWHPVSVYRRTGPEWGDVVRRVREAINV